MVEYEWFSYELIQYASSDCIVLYLYAHIDYKDTWFSHELTQYVSLDFPWEAELIQFKSSDIHVF